MPSQSRPHVIIIGGGFAGLYAAKSLSKTDVSVTLIDKRNFHLFQPLLYQVASGALSPGDIASPLRHILRKSKQTQVLLDEVIDIDPQQKWVKLKTASPLQYDFLIVAPGATHQYFGHDDWEQYAPGLKTLEDALQIRRRILSAFESAERESNVQLRQPWMTFVIIGGGPTGVELAGTLAELAYKTLQKQFRAIQTNQARIILIEAGTTLLGNYPEVLAQYSLQRLIRLGVEVQLGCKVLAIDGTTLTLQNGEQTQTLQAQTILWTAGVQVSPLGKRLAEKTGSEMDKSGRLRVQSNLSLPKFSDIYVIGDLAHVLPGLGQAPLPGLAAVAMQQGKYMGIAIQAQLLGHKPKDFVYQDKGNMAIIGRNAAVAQIGKYYFTGFIAWILWLFIHIYYLIGFENKILVLFQWAWNYLTQSRFACLIIEPYSADQSLSAYRSSTR